MKFNINPFNNLYDQNNITDKSHRRDLSLFAYAVTLGTVFFAVSAGTPFTGLAVALGADDMFYSLLFAIPLSTCFLQFFASWLLEKTHKRKTIFIIAGLFQRILWIPVALVPLFVPMNSPSLRLWAVITLITLSSLGGAFMNVSFFSWLGDVVPLKMRGRYLGLRSSIATILGLISAFAASFVLDHMPGLTGYTLVFGVGAIFGLADIVLFLWINDPPMQRHPQVSYIKSFLLVVKDKEFLLYLLFWTAWVFSWNLSGPFFNKYCLDKLHLSLSVTTLAGQVASGIMTFVFIQWWGRKLDHRGHRWVLLRCGIVGSVVSLVWLFASPGQFWPLLIFALVNGMFTCGVDITSMHMLVTVTPQQNRSIYIALYMVITSLAGASLGYLAGGGLLNLMGELKFNLLGITFDRYKLLFIGAGMLRLLVILCLLPLIANLGHSKGEDKEMENMIGRVNENA